MAEYIEREAAIEALRECVRAYPNSFYNGIEVARTAILKLPSADVAPVRRGRWVKIRPLSTLDGTYYCPCCGHETDIADGEITPIDVGFLFCPNCGAKMEVEE